jgi:hypothetical protein
MAPSFGDFGVDVVPVISLVRGNLFEDRIGDEDDVDS